MTFVRSRGPAQARYELFADPELVATAWRDFHAADGADGG
jgi:hypothetical protein